jgi:hypothetical protein
MIGGRVRSIDERTARNGNQYLRVRLEGADDEMMVMVFGTTVEACRDLREGAFVGVRGVLSAEYRTFKADEIVWPPEPIAPTPSGPALTVPMEYPSPGTTAMQPAPTVPMGTAKAMVAANVKAETKIVSEDAVAKPLRAKKGG